jgi:hypothetical protein
MQQPAGGNNNASKKIRFTSNVMHSTCIGRHFL